MPHLQCFCVLPSIDHLFSKLSHSSVWDDRISIIGNFTDIHNAEGASGYMWQLLQAKGKQVHFSPGLGCGRERKLCVPLKCTVYLSLGPGRFDVTQDYFFHE